MNSKNFYHCPVCNEKLIANRLACPNCKAEFPMERELSPYDYLSEDDSLFLQTFLICRGNLKDVQNQLGLSYPTATKKLDKLLTALGFLEEKKETFDMKLFYKLDKSSTKASDIIKNKLYENGGKASVYSKRGEVYTIEALNDGKSFYCEALPVKPPYDFSIFDVVVDLLLEKGGKARKGNGRNYRLGYGQCTEDTVVGAIGKNYAKKNMGDSVYDPVFVLAAVLEWADIAYNGRGYLELTENYCALLEKQL